MFLWHGQMCIVILHKYIIVDPVGYKRMVELLESATFKGWSAVSQVLLNYGDSGEVGWSSVQWDKGGLCTYNCSDAQVSKGFREGDDRQSYIIHNMFFKYFFVIFHQK